jgi:hypothetical protein
MISYVFNLFIWYTIIKHMISTRWLANPNQGRSRLSHNFRSSYEYLIHSLSE